MPFRLFGSDKTYKTHKQAKEAAIEAGQSGYVWFGAGDKEQQWIKIQEEQKAPLPQSLSIVQRLREINIENYSVQIDGGFRNIPVASVCREAADEIERLQQIAEES